MAQGIPACGNKWLLEDIARGPTFSGGDPNRTVTIQSDCGAVGNIWKEHKTVGSLEEATAMALNAGVNTLCGAGAVSQVVASGMLTEALLTKRVEQTLVSHFQVSCFALHRSASFVLVWPDCCCCSTAWCLRRTERCRVEGPERVQSQPGGR